MGFLADRRWFRAIAGLYAFQMLASQRISWKVLNQLFLLLAFASLLIFLTMWLVLTPDSLTGGFFFVDVPSKGLRLRIIPIFVIWGSIYFGLKWIRGTFSISWLVNSVTATVMIGYVIFIYKSRAAMVVLAVVLVWMAVQKSPKGRRVRTLMIFSLLVAVLVGGMWISRPNVLRRQFSGLTVIATSIFSRDGEMDASLANRLSQGTLAWWSVSRSARTLLIGNGRLSRRLRGERRESFGHFYPVDIGWLGIVFLYGILGFLLVNIPFVLTWKMSRTHACIEDDIFLDSLKWWLVYLFLRSILNGMVVAFPALVVVPLFLIYWRCGQGSITSIRSGTERKL